MDPGDRITGFGLAGLGSWELDGKERAMSKKAMGIALFGSASAVTAGLGTWQMQRYNWKCGLIQERQEKLAAQPVPLKSSAGGRTNYERGMFFVADKWHGIVSRPKISNQQV